MKRDEIQAKIKTIRDELESRHHTGIAKSAADGKPVPSDVLQNEMFSLILKLAQKIREEEEEISLDKLKVR